MDLLYVFIHAIQIVAELGGQPWHYITEFGLLGFAKLFAVSFVFMLLQFAAAAVAAGTAVSTIIMEIFSDSRGGRHRSAGR